MTKGVICDTKSANKSMNYYKAVTNWRNCTVMERYRKQDIPLRKVAVMLKTTQGTHKSRTYSLKIQRSRACSEKKVLIALMELATSGILMYKNKFVSGNSWCYYGITIRVYRCAFLS